MQGDSITITDLSGTFSDAGAGENKTVTIDSSNVTVEGTNADCYDIIYPSAIATINKAQAPEIVWSTVGGLTYGQKLSESTLTSTDEFGTFAWQNGDTVPSVTNDGFVVVYTPNDTHNYDYTGVELTKTIPVTVSPKKVTVTAGNITVCVDGTYTLTYTASGFIGNDTLTAIPTLTTDATVNTAGEYTITVSGADAGDNYSITYENGTLTVRNHAYNGVVTASPTCSSVGEMTYTCSHDSSHTYTEDVDALGHKYDNACDSECNTCGEERTPAEHYSENADGKCDECGESFELSGGAIAGIVIGSVAALGGGGFALFWFVFRKKRRI